jgi:hypothetical protein
VSNARRSHAEYPMVKIPAGEIELRDDRLKTTWAVEVNSFLLAVGPNDHPQAPSLTTVASIPLGCGRKKNPTPVKA